MGPEPLWCRVKFSINCRPIGLHNWHYACTASRNWTCPTIPPMRIPLVLDRSRPATPSAIPDHRAVALRHPARPHRARHAPSSRRLAEQLGVSRNTVVRAYDALSSDGYVEARPASGVAAVRIAGRHTRRRRLARSARADSGDRPAMPMPATRCAPRTLTTATAGGSRSTSSRDGPMRVCSRSRRGGG